MPGAKKSRVPVEKVTATLPKGMYEEVVAIVREGKSWLSAIDFIRESVKEKLERWKKEHPLGLPPPQRER